VTGGTTPAAPARSPSPAGAAVGALVGVKLAALSFASGCTDILSYRQLGQVFTSAMTGNIALLGLDLGQGNLPATSRNMAAFAGFLTGLLLGAALLRGQRGTPGWSRAMTRALLAEEVLLAAFAALWYEGRGPSSDGLLYGLIALSAIAMGVQSIVAHRAGVTGITTTYFTGTLTQIVVGATGGNTARLPEGRPPPRIRWPVFSFLAYVTGAVLASFLLTQAPVPALALPAVPAAAIAGVLLLALANDVGGMLKARRAKRRQI
jgi:uncharacterized membrane protein YoaK (UPF0700 family)